MPTRLTPPVERSFTMDATDTLYGGGDEVHTVIVIRQATQRAHEKIDDLNAEYKRIYNTEDAGGGQVAIQQKFNLAKLNRLQAFLTIVSCELEDANGERLFDTKALTDEKVFERVWGSLPPDVCDEIIKFVYQVNPLWDPNRGESD